MTRKEFVDKIWDVTDALCDEDMWHPISRNVAFQSSPTSRMAAVEKVVTVLKDKYADIEGGWMDAIKDAACAIADDMLHMHDLRGMMKANSPEDQNDIIDDLTTTAWTAVKAFDLDPKLLDLLV